MKIFILFKKIFFIGLTILSNCTNVILLNSIPLNCILMKNQECKIKPQVINVNSNNPIVYPFSIKTSKCRGNCNNFNNPYAKICVPDVIKDLIVCNNKQRWNKNKCRCECGELIDTGICDKGFIWNPSICDCECDKTCDIGEYLDYENCKCRKKIVNKLIDEWAETIEEVKLAKKTLENENENKYSSCKVYIVFMILVFTTFTGIAIYFVYYNWSLIKNNVSCIKFNTRKETKIWWMQFHWM